MPHRSQATSGPDLGMWAPHTFTEDLETFLALDPEDYHLLLERTARIVELLRVVDRWACMVDRAPCMAGESEPRLEGGAETAGEDKPDTRVLIAKLHSRIQYVLELAESLGRLCPAAHSAGADPQEKSEEHEDLVLRELEAQRARFDGIKESLLANPDYRDTFVAVKSGSVVDKDTDEFALVERVCDRYPHEAIYVGKVSPEVPCVEVSSPEVDW